MITLLHGDNIEASRQELSRLKTGARGKEVRQLDGRSVDETLLVQSLESASLFGGDTLVVIENLFGKLGKNPKRIGPLASILANCAGQADIILWEDKELGKTVTELFGRNIQVKLFKTPVLLWKFLDSLRPGNARILLPLLRNVLATEPTELLFTMVVRRLRQLLMIRDNVIPEGLPAWQTSRLTSQAKSFTMEKLVTMYKKLLNMEVAIKTGNSPFTLSQHIEQLLIDL